METSRYNQSPNKRKTEQQQHTIEDGMRRSNNQSPEKKKRLKERYMQFKKENGKTIAKNR